VGGVRLRAGQATGVRVPRPAEPGAGAGARQLGDRPAVRRRGGRGGGVTAVARAACPGGRPPGRRRECAPPRRPPAGPLPEAGRPAGSGDRGHDAAATTDPAVRPAQPSRHRRPISERPVPAAAIEVL
jgi:hypothetical protein